MLDPDLDNAHLNLGIIYMNRGKYETALKYCDSASAINPYNSGCRLTRGNIYQRQEKFADAIKQYYHVLKADSLNVRAWFFLAICRQELDNYDGALEAYERTLALNRDNAVAYYNRGLLYLNQDNYPEALADFDHVVRLSPKNIYAYYIRGIIKSGMEDFDGAESDFSTAIDLFPGLIHAYRDRSITRLARNDLKGYAEDKNTVDSLLQIRVPGFDLSEISYLKTITDFNSDFTPAERVRSSKVQYSDKEIQMISVFHIVPRRDQYDQSYKRVDDLRLYEETGEPVLVLEMKNYDYTMPEENMVSRVEQSALISPRNITDNILLESLVLGWQMKYRDAIKILDESAADLLDNYLAWFIRGNYNFAIGEIIASIESRDIYTSEDNSTMMGYYRAAIEDYNRSLELNPDFIYSRFNRACLKSMSAKPVPAIEDFTKCIEQDPLLGEAYFNRGLLEIFMDDAAQGCRDLSLAGELGINASYSVIYKFCRE